MDLETPEDIIADMVNSLLHESPPRELRRLRSAEQQFFEFLSDHIQFSPPSVAQETNQQKVLILIGPTGVGKTTTIAKLAAAFALNPDDRKSVALFTMDTFRIGAQQQLAQYAQIIEADMEMTLEVSDIEVALETHRDKDVILVDTAGRCPKDHQELAEMQKFVSQFPTAEKFLVVSATSKYRDLQETVRRFGKLDFNHLIFTKIDETDSIGPLLGLLYKSPLSLSYITHGQHVPDDFSQADLTFFREHIQSTS